MSVTQHLNAVGGQSMHSDPVQATEYAASPAAAMQPGAVDIVIGLAIVGALYFVSHILHRRAIG